MSFIHIVGFLFFGALFLFGATVLMSFKGMDEHTKNREQESKKWRSNE